MFPKKIVVRKSLALKAEAEKAGIANNEADDTTKYDENVRMRMTPQSMTKTYATGFSKSVT